MQVTVHNQRSRGVDAIVAPRGERWHGPYLLSRDVRAFTLIEIIVVVLIIAIAAGVFLPRLGGNADRRAQVEAEGVRELISILAEQQSDVGVTLGTSAGGVDTNTASGVASLLFNPETNSIGIVRRVAGDRKGEWADQADRLVSPVPLDECVLAQVVLDGRVQEVKSGEAFRIDFVPRQPRPAVSIVLVMRRAGSGTFGSGSSSAGAERSWQIDLAPLAAAATMRELAPGTRVADPLVSESVDLDLNGEGDSPW